VIRRTRSTAIAADSLHYKTDVLSNAAIILALVLSQYGWIGVDPVFALCIAAYVLLCAWRIGRDAFHDLLDRELPDEQRQQIIGLATAHPEVHGLHDLRTRMSGRIAHIQLHLELDDALPLLDSHRIADEVEAGILELMPGADVVIHQDPVGAMDARQAELS
jgi:ferrous-iron efflux pump FieF